MITCQIAFCLNTNANIDVYLAYAEKWLHYYLGGAYEPINQKSLPESSVEVQE